MRLPGPAGSEQAPVVQVHSKLMLSITAPGRATAAAIATALLFGTVPAFRATRVKATDALKEQGRGMAGEGRFGFGNALVVA